MCQLFWERLPAEMKEAAMVHAVSLVSLVGIVNRAALPGPEFLLAARKGQLALHASMYRASMNAAPGV